MFSVRPEVPHHVLHAGTIDFADVEAFLLELLQAFERAVLDGTVRHRGDAAIGEQLAWPACDRFENGDVRRLRKLDRSRPIDASVALALAVHGAVLGEGGASVYEMREAIAV